MKITGNGYEISRYVGEKVLSPGKEDSEKTSAQSNIPPESTGDAVVNLSEVSKEVQRAREVIESEPDVRLERFAPSRKGSKEESTKSTPRKQPTRCWDIS